MKNINTTALLWLAFILFGVIAWGFNAAGWADINEPSDWLGLIGRAVAVEGLLWACFVKAAWRWSFWHYKGWLVTAPVVHGTWRGHLYSNWVNPETGAKLDPIPTQLAIHQTLFTLSCTQLTGESRSTSFAEAITVDSKDPTIIELAYCYRNTPDEQVRERSNLHEGAAVLRFSKSNGKRLDGSYWTNRRPTPTTGDMRLEFAEEEPRDSLPLDHPPHPGPVGKPK